MSRKVRDLNREELIILAQTGRIPSPYKKNKTDITKMNGQEIAAYGRRLALESEEREREEQVRMSEVLGNGVEMDPYQDVALEEDEPLVIDLNALVEEVRAGTLMPSQVAEKLRQMADAIEKEDGFDDSEFDDEDSKTPVEESRKRQQRSRPQRKYTGPLKRWSVREHRGSRAKLIR